MKLVLLSLLLSVPIGIVINILTPLVERLFSGTSARARRRLEARSARRQELARQYAAAPHRLTQFLVMGAVTVGTLIMIAGGSVVTSEVLRRHAGSPPGWRWDIGEIIVVFGTSLFCSSIARLCFSRYLDVITFLNDEHEKQKKVEAANKQTPGTRTQ